ncbi:MAG: 30S ribosomal protein S5 [Candidatus Nanoarchaeia archaeon]|nr:30S ribosomal protein S5 [Candidatus Nanoarchaeia archaeon]
MAEQRFAPRRNFEPRKRKTKEEIAIMREERAKQQQATDLENWNPKTKLGKLVKEGKINKIDDALNYKILEPEIVDTLSKLNSDVLNIGQAKGKFGGGKRRAWRQTQKKTAEGNVPTFACLVVVGNGEGYVGLGYGRAKETLPARAKALRKAKLGLMKIKRACASFDCNCGELHTVPFIVEGKCGSCRVKLIPAPQGTGLVIGDECKKILKAAGIKDVYSVSTGQIRTTINLGRACMDALKKTMEM